LDGCIRDFKQHICVARLVEWAPAREVFASQLTHNRYRELGAAGLRAFKVRAYASDATNMNAA